MSTGEGDELGLPLNHLGLQPAHARTRTHTHTVRTRDTAELGKNQDSCCGCGEHWLKVLSWVCGGGRGGGTDEDHLAKDLSDFVGLGILGQ